MRKLPILIAFTWLLCIGASAQFSSITNINPLPVTTDTKDVPQSKVWIHDNRFWAVLTDTLGTHVWRLDGKNWTKTLTIAQTEYARADCKVTGNLVHIFLYRKARSYLISLEYAPETFTYKFWTERLERAMVLLTPYSETATIDLDSQNRLWLAYDDTTSILVRWSDPPYMEWSEPIVVASGIDPDDIGAVIAMPNSGQIGVIWSDQQTQRFGFRLHTDGTDPGSWLDDEMPAFQSAINIGGGMANDHLHAVVARDGTLYCAVKTNYNMPGYPRIAMLVRRPTGNWDNLYEVSQSGTRGIALLNEQTGKLRVVYTADEDGGDILYKESGLDEIAFGPQYILFSGKYNHCTSIKNNTTPMFLVMASNAKIATGVLAADALRLQLEASPNPFQSITQVRFSVPGNTRYELNLYNLTGNLLLKIRKGHTKYGEKNIVDLEAWQLPYGIYIMRLETEKRTKSIKLLRL